MTREDKIIRDFEKRFGSFTFNNGGALELTLWDIVDDRVHSENEVGIEIQNFILETLTTYRAQVLEEEKTRLKKSEDEQMHEALWKWINSPIHPTN